MTRLHGRPAGGTRRRYDPERDAHGHARPGPPVPATLMAWSVAQRLGVAALAAAVIWGLVLWSMG
ncbi:MAG: hypothetical protein R3D33_01290 [Hyphomicrobiaceae bacterium]